MKRVGAILGLLVATAVSIGVAPATKRTKRATKIQKDQTFKGLPPSKWQNTLESIGVKPGKLLNYLSSVFNEQNISVHEVVDLFESNNSLKGVMKALKIDNVASTPQRLRSFLESLGVRDLPKANQMRHVTEVFNGLDPEQAAEILDNNNYSVQEVLTVHRIRKPGTNGGNRGAGGVAGGGSG